MPAPVGPAVPDRDGRGRRHRGDLEAGGVGRAGRAPTRCATSCCTRCTTPRATSRPTSSPTSRRRASTTCPTIASASPACTATPATEHVQAAARVARGLVGRGAGRVLVARRVREGQGDGRDPGQAGRDGGARGRRVAHRVLGRRRARRADRPRTTGVRAARVRAARRVALRRPTHGRAGRPRARAAHAVGAARGHDGSGAGRRGRDRAAGDLADARRQGSSSTPRCAS